MKKTVLILIIMSTAFTGCKSSSHKCDAYGLSTPTEEFDIHKTNFESQEKYTSITSVK